MPVWVMLFMIGLTLAGQGRKKDKVWSTGRSLPISVPVSYLI